jgi:predicted SAM-dependent methyltransferase
MLESGARVIALDLEASHLASITQQAEHRSVADRLTTVVGQFPDSLRFEELDAIHCSNVLHFLPGEEIESGAAKMYEWLKPGGKVFLQVGTVYAGHIKQLLPIFEESRRSSVKWAGETHRAREFVASDFRDATPAFMNYLDEFPVLETFKASGFCIEKGWYYTRNGLPESLRSDGREHYGLIAAKPDCPRPVDLLQVSLNENQVTSAKEEALESLGLLLPSYTALQEHYSSHVHLPDYRAFSGQWEESLYRPIRDAARFAIDRPTTLGRCALLYCAPGPHAPLLHYDGAPRLLSRFDRVTLLDIDAAALQSAKKNLQGLNGDAAVEEIAFDFSGPFGQRLCDVYSDALRMADSPTAVAERLSGASLLGTSIFFDDDQVLTRLRVELDLASGGRRYTQSVSEMVASFTGTAVWLAFRSALYHRFARQAAPEDLGVCLRAATLLWQRYNECFLAFHLKFLRRQMVSGGSLLIVFDTQKVYDDPEREMLRAFLPETSLAGILESQGFRNVRHAILSWRDHPEGFEVSLYGIPVSDFQAHTHDVELFVLEAAS